jgi:hypothetical protein
VCEGEGYLVQNSTTAVGVKSVEARIRAGNADLTLENGYIAIYYTDLGTSTGMLHDA